MARGGNKSTRGSVNKSGKDPNYDTSLDVSDDDLYDDSPCPCKLSDLTSWKLSCTKCKQLWHSSCVNLKGVSEEFINLL